MDKNSTQKLPTIDALHEALENDNRETAKIVIANLHPSEIADIFADKLDFLSIGTNDLIQYTMAIDRINDEVNYLYDPLHPAVLRLIQTTIIAGQKANIPISMCGEMAGEKEHTKLLLGLGLREFSMHPATLLEVKEIINKTNIRELTELTKTALLPNNKT